MTIPNVVSDAAHCPVGLIRAVDTVHADRAVRRGRWVRIVRGVYADADDYRSLPPWDRYPTRVHAVGLAWPGSVFVRESAAALRGLPVFGEPPMVHVVVPAPQKSRTKRGIHVHSATRSPAIEQLGALRVCGAAETIVDMARERHPAVALAIACAALRDGHLRSIDDAVRVHDRALSTRGRRRAEWVFDRASATPESTLEAVSLAVIEWLGFPRPELQKWIFGPDGADGDRLDFWWDRWRIGGEADGGVKYSGALGSARAALRARNARDARLGERGVSATAHWTWADVSAPRQLRALLRAAGLPLTGPEHTELLRTLAAALRGRA